jgi:HK97 family phage major capsid protein
MTHAGNFTAFVPSTGDTEFDSISRAAGELETAGYTADVLVLHPRTARAIQRIKTGGDGSGEYVATAVAAILTAQAGNTVWRIPVVTSVNVPEGSFILFSLSAVGIFDRQEAVVEFFPQDGTNVQQNLTTVRGEGRFAFAVFQPGAILYGPLVIG